MKRYAVLFAILIALTAVLAGCKGDTGPAGPSLKGNIYGTCGAVDLVGIVATNNSGIVVRVEGKNIGATTDSTGRFALIGVPVGTHVFSFSKAGYGTRKYVGQQFAGGGDVWWGTTLIFALPAFSVDSLAAVGSPGNIGITGKLIGALPAFTRYVRLFVSTSPAVSSDPSKYILSVNMTVSSVSTSLSLGIPTGNLSPYGIGSGQTIYLIAYAEAVGSTSYVDFSTGRLIYTSLGSTPSNVASVVVP